MMLSAYRVSKCFNKTTVMMRSCFSLTLSVKEALSGNSINENVRLKGWVQAIRKHKNLVFVDLIDGRSLDRLQVVIKPDERNTPAYGSSISVEGLLAKSEQKGQEVELLCNVWNTIGPCPEDYPFLARHHHPVEYIRQLQHLRPKTRTFKSVLRVRNFASMAIHSFFQAQGFQFIHTPIITLNDCEGAGEVFSVKHEKKPKMKQMVKATDRQCIDGIQTNSSNNKDENIKIDIPSGSISDEEFFKNPAYLTVSGQLHLEAVACALSQVYSFGPVFRAENSCSNCHLSEFYMVEAEIAFAESLEDLIKLVEACIKNVSKHILDVCEPEINLLCQKYTAKHQKYVKKIIETPFAHISYSDALNILQKNKNFLKTDIKWGVDFSSEHLKFLMKYCDSIPVFISHYPKSLKPFYMKTNESGKAYCFDLYAPFGGEICGGSLREENESTLKNHLDAMKITDSLSWYLELRKYGTVPHGGFGIGFDRLLQLLLGISNIRDVTPFPRWNDHCKL